MSKSASKAIAKSRPTKSTPAKAAAPGTVAELHAQVEKISARLSRADATTRRNVRALDGALKAFEARSDADASSSRAGLVRRIESVKSQLSSLAVDTRVAVRDDLKAALTADHPKRVAEVLFKVDMKIEASEREQSRAVARLNQHLADMARAMDARLVAVESAQNRETEARREALDVMTGRIDAVEAETARAVTDIGERMVGLATRLREDIEAVRSEGGSDGNAAELVVRAKTEMGSRMDELSRTVDGRVERAVRSANDADVRAADIERAQAALVAELTARIDGLEHQLSRTQDIAQTTRAEGRSAPAGVETPATVPVPSAATAKEDKAVQGTPAQASLQTAPAPVPAPAVMDLDAFGEPVPLPMTAFEAPAAALTPSRPTPSQPIPVQTNPSDAMHDPDLPGHYPVEFVPGTSAASAPAIGIPNAPMSTVSITEPVAVPVPVIPQPSPAMAAPSISQFDMPIGMPDFADVPQPSFQPTPLGGPQPGAMDSAPVPHITDADLPYGDPGYAETGPMARPGGEEARSSRLGRINPRTLRLGGLAACVALVGTFAVSQVIGGTNDTSSLPSADQAAISGANAPQVAFTDTEGDMSQLSMPMMIDGEPGFDTLEAAVDSDNPIAQYQMGLIKFEERDIEGALALVRASADQGLPASQYRLAKFYEAGQGVSKDLPTAFRLTEMAARQGHRIAMHDTAVFYAQGVNGSGPDHAQALQWFEKAARLGVLDSQFNIAHLLHTGQELGIQQDLGSAYVWYAVAAQNGDQEAMDRMNVLREGFTPEQLADLEARISGFSVQPMDEAANGIFRDLPWTAPAIATADADRESIRQVQSLLNELGYDTGTPDGIPGKKTRDAIVDFERANSMAETGQASPELLQELERVAGA